MPLYLDDLKTPTGMLEDVSLPGSYGVSSAFESSIQEGLTSSGLDSLTQFADRVVSSNPYADTRISVDEAKRQVGDLDIDIPEGGISQDGLDFLIQRKARQNVLASRIASTPQSFGQKTAEFGASFVGQMVDPLNILSAFVPIVGEQRYAAALARAGESFAPRLAVRAKFGAVEGVAGAAMVEPALYGARQYLQDDYTMMDSLTNVIMGAPLGSFAHSTFGAAGDFLDPPKNAMSKALDGAPPLVKETAVRASVAQMLDDKVVDATPILNMSDSFAQRNVFDDTSLQKDIDLIKEIEYPLIKQELTGLAANKISRGEVKTLKSELQELQRKKKLVQVTDENIKIAEQEFFDKSKNVRAPARIKKKAIKSIAENDAAQTRLSIDEKIRTINDRLSKSDLASEAEAMLSRIEQGLPPQKIIDIEVKNKDIKNIQLRLSESIKKNASESISKRVDDGVSRFQDIQRNPKSSFDDPVAEKYVSDTIEEFSKKDTESFKDEDYEAEFDTIMQMAKLNIADEASFKIFNDLIDPYSQSIRNSSDYAAAVEKAAYC